VKKVNRKKINIIITILLVIFISFSSLACVEGVLCNNPFLNLLTRLVVSTLTDYQISQIDYSKLKEESGCWINGRKVSEDEFNNTIEALKDDYEEKLSFKLKESDYNNFPDASFVGASEVYTISAEGKTEDKIFSLSDIQDIRNSSGEQTSQEASTSKNVPKGSITLTGSIEAPSLYNLSPLTLIIDLDTGVVTGSFTGSYYFEGYTADLGYFGKIVYPPDTANIVADIEKGTVDIKTGKIIGAGAVVYTWASGAAGETFTLIMEGELSPDYKDAHGKFVLKGEEYPWEASTE
jgi:hypothetical protein